MKILVTGGCGYIGSHTIVDLINNGFDVVSLDNLSNSDEQVMRAIESITDKTVTNYKGDIRDAELLEHILNVEKNIEGVIHFAALKSVNESVFKPIEYYDNNVSGLVNLVRSLEKHQVKYFIFSSSCSVYGNTGALPVKENTPFEEAQSPYARTKQIGEYFLEDYTRQNKNFKTVLLRYFNPAGAHESALIGENPINVASNLVPVITETAIGKRSEMTVFGTDYPTRDGSCVRDYIHVMDLANAHIKALQYLIDNRNDKPCEVFNVGIGQGVTVLEAIHAFEKTTEKAFHYKSGPRRDGDVIAIYADPRKSMERLGWQPKYDIDDIMSTAWKWEIARNDKGHN